MVEDKIQEEILYREGLALGLDKDDTIVKRRMAQKLQFLAEDVAAAHEPTMAELKAWFREEQPEVCAAGSHHLSPRVLLSRHARTARARRGGRCARKGDRGARRLEGGAAQGRSLHVPGGLQRSFDRAAGEGIRTAVRAGHSDAQARFVAGPIESGYGWHLVFVESFMPGRIPALEEIESDVKTAWLGDQKEHAWRKAYKEMRANYTVLLPRPPDDDVCERVRFSTQDRDSRVGAANRSFVVLALCVPTRGAGSVGPRGASRLPRTQRNGCGSIQRAVADTRARPACVCRLRWCFQMTCVPRRRPRCRSSRIRSSNDDESTPDRTASRAAASSSQGFSRRSPTC